MGTITVTLTEEEVRALLHSTGRGHQRPTKHKKNLLTAERKLLGKLPPFSASAYRALEAGRQRGRSARRTNARSQIGAR